MTFRLRHLWRAPPYLLVFVLGGTVVTTAAAAAWARDLRGEARDRIDRRTDETVRRFSDELRRSADPLRGARGVFGDVGPVDAAAFARYVASLELDQRHPGIRAIGFTEAVPPGPTGAPERRIVRFVEPRGAAIVGTDAMRHPVVRRAQDAARDAGAPVASEPFALSPAIGGGTGFALVLPVYRTGRVPDTVAARRAALVGWTGAAVRGGAFVDGTIAETHEPWQVELYGGRPAVFLGGVGRGPAAGPVSERRVELYGQIWRVRTRPLGGFVPSAYRVGPLVLLGGGLLLTGVLALLGHVLVTRRRHAERVAAARTRDLLAGEARFRTLVQSSPTGVFLTGSGDERYANPRLREMLGIGPDDPLPEGRSIVHPDDIAAVHEAWEAATRDGTDVHTRLRMRRPDGSYRSVDIVAAPVLGGDRPGWVGSATDVTDQVESQRLAERLTRVFEATSDLGAIWTGDGTLVWANAAMRRFAGFAAGQPDHRAEDLVAPGWLALYQAEVMPAVETAGHWSGELVLRGAAEHELPVSLVVVAQRGNDDRIEYFASLARDLTDRKEMERRLAHDALHDRLTGMPNRALFGDRLERALARSRRLGELTAVLFLDLDRFKVVNDSLGHDAGDLLLVEVARRLDAALRPGDTTSRFGGDEFTVLCENVAGEQEAIGLADRVLHAFATPFYLGVDPIHVSASIGIALSDGTDRPDDLLRDADVAMYRAKERGRSRYEVFDEGLRSHAVRRLELETALHRAIQFGELEVYYQPEVCLRDRTIVAVEALVRWNHPRDGLVSPGEFVPLAEETGLIEPLGEAVLRHACRQAVRWRHARADGAPLTVWVNVSPVQLARADFVQRVAAALHQAGAAPGEIGLEITESALLGDADAAIATLHRLRGLGVRLSLDDFGTGYSSLSYLKRLPIDAVKVDRSFVAGVTTDEDDAAIVAAIVAMAKALRITPFAEGVETAAQSTRLRELGCEVAQGFLYAQPMPADAIDRLLAAGLDEPTIPAPRRAGDDTPAAVRPTDGR